MIEGYEFSTSVFWPFTCNEKCVSEGILQVETYILWQLRIGQFLEEDTVAGKRHRDNLAKGRHRKWDDGQYSGEST